MPDDDESGRPERFLASRQLVLIESCGTVRGPAEGVILEYHVGHIYKAWKKVFDGDQPSRRGLSMNGGPNEWVTEGESDVVSGHLVEPLRFGGGF